MTLMEKFIDMKVLEAFIEVFGFLLFKSLVVIITYVWSVNKFSTQFFRGILYNYLRRGSTPFEPEKCTFKY